MKDIGKFFLIQKLLEKKMSRLKFNIKGVYDGKNYKK